MIPSDTHTTSIRQRVMEAIERDAVIMRPRWQYVLLSALALTGGMILVLTLLLIVSLGVFFLRESGVWFAPSFGARGWWELLRAVPASLLILLVVFTVLLELVARRYSFVYRKPLMITVAGILALVLLGGFFVERTMIHHFLRDAAHRHELPQPIEGWYKAPSHMARPNDLIKGTVIATTSDGFIVVDADHMGTTSVIISAHTRLPFGAGFAPGNEVVVIGDTEATDTVQAFGVLMIERE